jgi:electron transport complex protein RnfD
MFGGIGQNFINPALAARTILMLSWTGLMAATAVPAGGQLFGLTAVEADAVAAATPLVNSGYSLWQLFIGDVPGMLGETSKLALILGGIYLIVRRVIDWRVPVSFIATAFILFWIETGVIYQPGTADSAVYQLLSGGLMLGAFFMATDYVTCPVTKWGRVIMGVGCAALLFVIRAYGSYPEGCSFGILFMNVCTPLIDKWTTPKTFGAVKVKKGGAKA